MNPSQPDAHVFPPLSLLISVGVSPPSQAVCRSGPGHSAREDNVQDPSDLGDCYPLGAEISARSWGWLGGNRTNLFCPEGVGGKGDPLCWERLEGSAYSNPCSGPLCSSLSCVLWVPQSCPLLPQMNMGQLAPWEAGLGFC